MVVHGWTRISGVGCASVSLRCVINFLASYTRLEPGGLIGLLVDGLCPALQRSMPYRARDLRPPRLTYPVADLSSGHIKC
jgi:hypothetical protein